MKKNATTTLTLQKEVISYLLPTPMAKDGNNWVAEASILTSTIQCTSISY
jgi:hypothetical protein